MHDANVAKQERRRRRTDQSVDRQGRHGAVGRSPVCETDIRTRLAAHEGRHAAVVRSASVLQTPRGAPARAGRGGQGRAGQGRAG